MKEKNMIGSSFDEFLKEQKIYESVTEVAKKRVREYLTELEKDFPNQKEEPFEN